jgi:hypothetical protein
LFEKMDDLFHILRILFNILLYLRLLFYSKLGRASTLFMIIESDKMIGFPCIKPMVDRQPIDIKNVHKISCRPALETEENTMSTLSDPMMRTLFITSPEQMLCLRTEIVNKAHLSSRLVREGCSEQWLASGCTN